MRCYHRLSLHSILAAASLADFVMPFHLPLPPPWEDIRVKHTWNTVPTNWESLGPPPAGTTIDLHVALKPQHENALIDVLYEVSTPGHPKYGTHLSKEGVAKLVAPHRDTLELINSWLEFYGVPPSSVSRTHGGSWLTLTSVPVPQANELLGASYQLYRHAGTNDSAILRTVSYALPTVLHAHVQTVAPTTFFASTRTVPQTPPGHHVGEATALAGVASRELVPVLSSRDEKITPPVLRWLYKTYAYMPGATDRNVLGIAGYQDDYPIQDDLTTFMKTYRADAITASFTVEKVGSGGPGHPGPEANLNIQYAQAMAYPTPHIYYTIGGQPRWFSGNNEPAPGDINLQWFSYVLGQPNIPQTISTSLYGHDEREVPLGYATAVCTLFAQLGARGVSVLFATGDGGVGKGDCKVNDGSGRTQFLPTFPATCPWVTTVGGTTGQLPEVAVSISGGGFSFHFPRPNYQKDAVPTFLQHLGRQYDGLYNPGGRGIPDISAQAFDYLFIVNNVRITARGTICAAPTVAGIISLLNDFSLSNGKAPLGFLNPWLYGSGLNGLNDVIYGSNPGCGTDGFSAVAGWDPVPCHGSRNAELYRPAIYT